MPTNLPRRHVEPRRSFFSVVLNAFMVGSVLILTIMVLMQEERYAMGQPGSLAGALEQMAQQTPADMAGDTQVIPPD